MTILQLSPKAFKGQFGKPKRKGINQIFRGKVKVDPDTDPIRCYIKPLPDHILCPVTNQMVPNRELVAEAIGYVLARESGLNVPTHAGVILLRNDQIPPEAKPPRTPGYNEEDGMLAWFSEDMIHPDYALNYMDEMAPRKIQERMFRNLVAIIKEAPGIHDVLAFDDWLLNSDRHFGNVLVSKGKPIVIDHGRIFGYPNWSPGGYGRDTQQFRNRMLEMISSVDAQWADEPHTKNKRLFAFEALKHCYYKSGETVTRKVLLEFFKDTQDVDAILQLIAQRVQDARYNKAVGLLI